MLFFALCMWCASLWLPSMIKTITAIHLVVTAIVAMAGVIVAIVGVFYFHQARTTVNPLKPEAASALVTLGIYQYTRNPMYVGMVLVLCAWGIFLGVLWNVLFVMLFMIYIQQFQIIPEEKALERMFPEDFLEYRKHVRRWL